jgi:hypothetical protein
MNDMKLFKVLGAVVAVLLVIGLFLPRDNGPDVGELIAKEIAPISDAVSELGGRVDAVEGSLGDISEQLAAAVTPEALDEVSARVDEALAETDGLKDSIATMQDTMESAAAAAAVAPEPQAVEAAERTAPEVAEAPADSVAGAFKPGETASFADGALRVFVSRLDSEAGEVRLSVLGEMKTLTVGQARTIPVGDDYCRVTVAGVSASGVSLDSLCGDELPAPEGINAGKTALLADGAVRVFASRIVEEEARLSVNGEMHTLPVGGSVAVMAGEDPCRVYLDALDRGHALVSARCGAEFAVSDLAGAGSTVLLGDGAVRVFVGSVQEDAVRYSINGQTLMTGAAGDRQAIGEGCAVMVEAVEDGQASFSHSCDS